MGKFKDQQENDVLVRIGMNQTRTIKGFLTDHSPGRVNLHKLKENKGELSWQEWEKDRNSQTHIVGIRGSYTYNTLKNLYKIFIIVQVIIETGHVMQNKNKQNTKVLMCS